MPASQAAPVPVSRQDLGGLTASAMAQPGAKGPLAGADVLSTAAQVAAGRAAGWGVSAPGVKALGELKGVLEPRNGWNLQVTVRQLAERVPNAQGVFTFYQLSGMNYEKPKNGDVSSMASDYSQKEAARAMVEAAEEALRQGGDVRRFGFVAGLPGQDLAAHQKAMGAVRQPNHDVLAISVDTRVPNNAVVSASVVHLKSGPYEAR